ncbi:MAG TPA: alcohol dehydrogenase catalytic domain-containing protein [Candidatus Xenobia bacterium]
MRAWQFDGPDSLRQVDDAPVPEAGYDEVRLQVAACGVNPVDKIFMSGTYPVTPRPHIGGIEMAGTIDQIGAGVTGLSVGTRVGVSFRRFCGLCRSCQRGDEVDCERLGGILGGVSNGGYAEYAVVPAANALPLPDTLTFSDAASLVLSTATAWHMMVDRARVSVEDRVVVFAASGGVGSAAVQIARLSGAFVVAVAGRGKTDDVKALGAHVVFERGQAGLVEAIRQATDGGADLVCNPVGAGIWQESIGVLRNGGRWTTCGVLAGDQVQFMLRPFYNHQHTLIGAAGSNRRDTRAVLEAAGRGELKVTRWKVYPFDELPQAIGALGAPERVGKVVLRIG